MGVKNNPTYVDDYTGEVIEDFDESKHVDELTINGTTYRLMLTEESKQAVDKWLEDLTEEAEVKTIEKPATAPKVSRATEDRHGLDHVKVRDWAIKNKIKNGKDKDKVITDKTPRLSQHVWDAAEASDERDSLTA